MPYRDLTYVDWLEKILQIVNLPFRLSIFDFYTAEELVKLYKQNKSPKEAAKRMQIGVGFNKTGKVDKVDKIIKDLKDLANKSPNINDFNSSLIRTKFKSEIVRILYYLIVGSQGPHLWGIQNRIQPPERSPLPLKDPNACKVTRETLEKLVNSSSWDSWIRQLLRAAKDELTKASKVSK